MHPHLRARIARVTRAQILTVNGLGMDMVHAWPGRTSLRIYSDCSGAYLDSPAYTGPLTRSEAARLLLAMRAHYREARHA